jgi:hypothetical protein
MEAPTAALPVAMMIAMAATSARSDRARASFFFRVIGSSNSFRFWFRLVNLAWSISPLRFLRRFFIRLRMRSCYFNQAASISLVLKKFRMVPAPWVLVPRLSRIVK